MEARSWSPVSEARGRREQPGECWIRSVKSPLSCSRTFHGSHLPCDIVKPGGCWRGLPRAGARPPGLTCSLCRMKRAVSLSTLHVGGARDTGAQVRGRQAHLVKDGMGGHADRPREGGDRLALGAGAVGGNGPEDRMDGWLYLGSGGRHEVQENEQYSHCSGQLAGRVGSSSAAGAGVLPSPTLSTPCAFPSSPTGT